MAFVICISERDHDWLGRIGGHNEILSELLDTCLVAGVMRVSLLSRIAEVPELPFGA